MSGNVDLIADIADAIHDESYDIVPGGADYGPALTTTSRHVARWLGNCGWLLMPEHRAVIDAAKAWVSRIADPPADWADDADFALLSAVAALLQAEAS